MTEAKRDLVLTRILDVPVERAWKAWSDPVEVMKWWGPDCFICPSARIDFREGGKSIVCMRGPAPYGDLYNSWAYTKIVPLQSIEFIQNMCDPEGRSVDPLKLGLPPDFPRDQRNVVTFKDSGLGTDMTVRQFDWTPGKMMDLGETGLKQCLAKMAASLSEYAVVS